MNRETCDFAVYAEKTVVEEVDDPEEQISLVNAKMMDSKYELGDIVQVPIDSKSFGRIATQNAKNLILQKIREEERKVVYDQYFEKEKDIVTGIVQRYVGRNISIDLGKADAMLTENEQVKGEVFKPTERIKLYVVEVKNTTKGPKILVSRTHPELVKRLFESEVTEVKDGKEISPFLGGTFVKIAFRMQIDDLVDSSIMQLYPIDFARKLVETFINTQMGSLGESNDQAATQPEAYLLPQQLRRTMQDR